MGSLTDDKRKMPRSCWNTGRVTLVASDAEYAIIRDCKGGRRAFIRNADTIKSLGLRNGAIVRFQRSIDEPTEVKKVRLCRQEGYQSAKESSFCGSRDLKVRWCEPLTEAISFPVKGVLGSDDGRLGQSEHSTGRSA